VATGDGPSWHNRDMADLITKLLPILHVKDPGEERRFYEQLGLRTTYEGPEYPDFIAVGNDAVEFGLTRRPDANPAAPCLTWQLGVSDIDTAVATCQRAGLSFEVAVERPRPDWTYRILKLRSPNGMEVLLEEQVPEP
jgi:predicted enzyme related to lactoylglutathione lyase